MKKMVLLIVAVVLGLLFLNGCAQPALEEQAAFDALARRVPANADNALFLDLKPSGAAGRYWERIRKKLEANQAAKETLDNMFRQFWVADYDPKEFLVGPAVNGYWGVDSYLIAQVKDEAQARQAILQHTTHIAWKQEEYEGQTLYYWWGAGSYSYPNNLAWTLHGGYLFLVSRYDRELEPVTHLEDLLDLDEKDSLAALPAWQTLRERLPDRLMGLYFVNAAEQARRKSSQAGGTSLGAIFGRQTEVLALAAVPEREGMRIEIAGSFEPGTATIPELYPLFDLPAVDPSTWSTLPADTAIALFAHDASTVWPALEDLLGLKMGLLSQLPGLEGLDLEAALLAAEGPLAGDFVLGITPPLPNQPISQDVAALQVLVLGRGATQAQVEGVRTAMEGWGVVFDPTEVEGMTLQTQVGTALTGYAMAYGLDGDTFLFGSSPGILGRGIAAGRAGNGLVKADAFRRLVAKLPGSPALVLYLNTPALTGLIQANVAEGQEPDGVLGALKAFDAVGLGLRLQPERLDGVLYFMLQ